MKNRCIIIVSSSSFAFVCVCVEIYFCFLGSFFLWHHFLLCVSNWLSTPHRWSIVSRPTAARQTHRLGFIYMSESSGPIFDVSTIHLISAILYRFLAPIFLSPPFILISLLLYFYEIKLTFSNLQIIYCVYFIGYSCEFYLSLWKYVYSFNSHTSHSSHSTFTNHNCVQHLMFCTHGTTRNMSTMLMLPGLNKWTLFQNVSYQME